MFTSPRKVFGNIYCLVDIRSHFVKAADALDRHKYLQSNRNPWYSNQLNFNLSISAYIYRRRIMQFPNPSESAINIILCLIRNSHRAWIAAFASFQAPLQVVDPCRG